MGPFLFAVPEDNVWFEDADVVGVTMSIAKYIYIYIAAITCCWFSGTHTACRQQEII